MANGIGENKRYTLFATIGMALCIIIIIVMIKLVAVANLEVGSLIFFIVGMSALPHILPDSRLLELLESGL
jgi:hypothetical protein